MYILPVYISYNIQMVEIGLKIDRCFLESLPVLPSRNAIGRNLAFYAKYTTKTFHSSAGAYIFPKIQIELTLDRNKAKTQ